jgi:hypothetical protein
MGWIDEWYPETISALVEKRGQGGDDTRGVAMPLLMPLDTLALLGLLSGPISQAIHSFQNTAVGELGDRVVLSSRLDDNGMIAGSVTALIAHMDGVKIADYVAGQPVLGVGPAWKRTITPFGPSYEPWMIESTFGGDETDLIMQVRALMTAWQAAVNAAVFAINAAGADIASRPMSTAHAAEFLRGVRQCAVVLDILAENPPTSGSEKIKGAALAALNRTETFIGETAANLATKVGELAGNVGSGFFSEAGITALIVAGIAVYLFIL